MEGEIYMKKQNEVKRNESSKGGNCRTTKPNNRRRGYSDRSKSDEVKTNSKDYSNDPSWYAKNPQLLKDAASLAFSNRSGDYLNLGVNQRYDYTGANPGILTMHWQPSLGKLVGNYDANAATDAVNMAALNVYSYVRHANSGSANYDAPDLMMAILAADSAFYTIAHMIRIYGVARLYDQKNRYLPKAILTALRVNPDEIINNLAKFRYGINNLIAKASVIWVPSNMSLVTRHFWMNSNIYKDSDSEKAQMYAFVPSVAWKFEPKTSETGSSLSNQSLDWSAFTVDQILYSVSSLMDPLISDEDMGIMFGDMLKAYGKENLYSLNMIDENYTVVPVFNKEVLMQIHNATALPITAGGVQQSDTGVIYQLTNPRPTTEYGLSQCFGPKKYIFDYQDMVPEPENIMVSSRLMQFVPLNGDFDKLIYSSTEGLAPWLICGSERIFSFRVWYYNESGGLAVKQFHSFMYENDVMEESIMELIDRFNWAPRVYIMSDFSYNTTTHAVSRTLDICVGDMDNYTVVDFSVIQKMHETAVLSEFDVPLMLQ